MSELTREQKIEKITPDAVVRLIEVYLTKFKQAERKSVATRIYNAMFTIGYRLIEQPEVKGWEETVVVGEEEILRRVRQWRAEHGDELITFDAQQQIVKEVQAKATWEAAVLKTRQDVVEWIEKYTDVPTRRRLLKRERSLWFG